MSDMEQPEILDLGEAEELVRHGLCVETMDARHVYGYICPVMSGPEGEE